MEAEIDLGSTDYHCNSTVLSSDRKYREALYSLFRHQRGYDTLITSIWEIEDNLNFGDIKQRKSWARRLQLLFTEYLGFREAYYPLAVGQDGLFATFSSLVDSHGGIRHSLSVNLIKDRYPEKGNRSQILVAMVKFFLMYTVPKEQIDKISWLEPELPIETISLSSLGSLSFDVEFNINVITDDGNYIVFHNYLLLGRMLSLVASRVTVNLT